MAVYGKHVSCRAYVTVTYACQPACDVKILDEMKRGGPVGLARPMCQRTFEVDPAERGLAVTKGR